MVVRPDVDDIVVRQKRGNPSPVFILGTSSAPAQFQVRSRDDAITQALAFAKRSTCGRGLPTTTTSCYLARSARTSNCEVLVMATRRKTNEPRATAANSSRKTARIRTANVSEQDIARRAYELYMARGAENGHDLDDWLQAERELRHPIAAHV